MKEPHPGVFAALTTALVAEGIVVLVILLTCATLLNMSAIVSAIP